MSGGPVTLREAREAIREYVAAEREHAAAVSAVRRLALREPAERQAAMSRMTRGPVVTLPEEEPTYLQFRVDQIQTEVDLVLARARAEAARMECEAMLAAMWWVRR